MCSKQNRGVFNMITGINESKTLTKHIHVNVNINWIKQNLIQINGGIIVKIETVKNIMFGILLHIIVKRKYIGSIIYDSMIMCDETINSDDKKVNFNQKKSVCKIQNVYFLLDFLLMTIALWIAVIINCYSIKYW